MLAYAVVGAALTVAYFTVPSQNAEHVIYQVFGVLGVVAVAVGMRRHRPSGCAWPLVLAGLVLWAGGDLYWNLHRLLLGTEAAFPSPADALYLLAYVPLLGAIVVMVRGGRPQVGDIVDAGIVGLAASLIVWFVAILPAARVVQPPFNAVVSDAYPTMDFLLVLALVQLLFSRTRTAALGWLVAGFGVVLVTDVVYAWLRSSGTFTTSSWINAGYFWFYLLLGASALAPSMTALSQRSGRPALSTRLGLGRFTLLAGALLATPAVLLLQRHSIDATRLVVLSSVESLIGILVLVRLLLLFVERDKSECERERAEADLQRMAYRDGLTDLPNRPALFAAIEDAVDRAGERETFAVVFVDLDGFKTVNDRHGHAEGDRVLRRIAGRLREAVRDADLVARHGGDEFIVLLRGLPPHPDDVVRSAISRLVAAVDAPLDPPGRDASPVRLGASIGVAVYPADGATSDQLIGVADKRMYEQKARRDATTPDDGGRAAEMRIGRAAHLREAS